jgi:hypothetical protein
MTHFPPFKDMSPWRLRDYPGRDTLCGARSDMVSTTYVTCPRCQARCLRYPQLVNHILLSAKE